MNIRLRELEQRYKDIYIRLQQEYRLKSALEEIKLQDGIWKDLQDEKRINYVIFGVESKKLLSGVLIFYFNIKEMSYEKSQNKKYEKKLGSEIAMLFKIPA